MLLAVGMPSSSKRTYHFMYDYDMKELHEADRDEEPFTVDNAGAFLARFVPGEFWEWAPEQ